MKRGALPWQTEDHEYSVCTCESPAAGGSFPPLCVWEWVRVESFDAYEQERAEQEGRDNLLTVCLKIQKVRRKKRGAVEKERPKTTKECILGKKGTVSPVKARSTGPTVIAHEQQTSEDALGALWPDEAPRPTHRYCWDTAPWLLALQAVWRQVRVTGTKWACRAVSQVEILGKNWGSGSGLGLSSRSQGKVRTSVFR